MPVEVINPPNEPEKPTEPTEGSAFVGWGFLLLLVGGGLLLFTDVDQLGRIMLLIGAINMVVGAVKSSRESE
jgi:hypothetical protein